MTDTTRDIYTRLSDIILAVIFTLLAVMLLTVAVRAARRLVRARRMRRRPVNRHVPHDDLGGLQGAELVRWVMFTERFGREAAAEERRLFRRARKAAAP